MKGLFDPEDAEIVLRWLTVNWERRRVVVVGSGFTRNADCPERTKIPLWEQLSQAIRGALGLKDDKFDALQLPDIYVAKHGHESLRELLERQLDDDALSPGRCHDALWASEPEAIITTNFLDTVLEKSRPRRAQIVVRDRDLGRPLKDPWRHVIYFHGHRRSPSTWVAGRQQYEQLPTRRPMIHAKVRQLLAEYPALIVGYSLSDPDFHFIYGDTLRAMSSARPKGLALSLWRRDEGALPTVDPHELSRNYWDTMGLSVVRFSRSASKDPAGAYAKFFALTAKVTTFSQLLPALCRPEGVVTSAQALGQNIKMGLSALQDESLAKDRLQPDAHHEWWRQVLARSLDDAAQQRAREAAREWNLRQHPFRSEQEGRRKRTGPQVQRTPSVLDPSVWVAGSSRWKHSATVSRLLELLDGGDEVARHIEQLLAAGASRSTLRTWIGVAVKDPEVVPRLIERSYVVSFALLSDGHHRALVEAFHVACRHSEKAVSDAVRAYLGTTPRRAYVAERTLLVTRLHEAARLLAEGERSRAEKEYQTIQDDLLRGKSEHGRQDRSLLAYFAAEGMLECTTWRTPIPRIEHLQRNRDRVAQEPSVRRWLDRMRVLKDGVLRAKAKHESRPGYESTSGGWSASPGELWHHYERASRLGAPLGLRRDLLNPLLGTIPAAEHELQERLRLRMKETGQWLEEAFQQGHFATSRDSFFPEFPRLGAANRLQAGTAISRQLFGLGGAAVQNASKLERSARIDVLGSFVECVLEKDVEHARRLLARASGRQSTGETMRAWLKLTHICPWSVVQRDFLRMAKELPNDLSLQRELLWGNGQLPWEHWSEIDRFWSKGGLTLLRSVVGARDSTVVGRVGWLLVWLLDTAPPSEMIKLSRQWLTSPDLNLADDDTLRAAVSLLAALPENAVRAPGVIRAAKKKATLGVLVGVQQSQARRSLRVWADAQLDAWVDREGWAKARESRTVGFRDEVIEAHCLVSVIKRSPERRDACWSRLFSLFDASWSALRPIGEILHPTYAGRHWPRLLKVLRVGGHARVAKSWLLARIRLMTEALDADAAVRKHVVESRELAFLRAAAIDAIAHGDSVLANNAIYVLPALARWTKEPDEVAAIAAALEAACDDIRIGVTHGAAFTAGFLTELSRYEPLSPDLVSVAQRVAATLADDPLAVVRRQLNFGRAKGALAGERARVANRPTA